MFAVRQIVQEREQDDRIESTRKTLTAVSSARLDAPDIKVLAIQLR